VRFAKTKSESWNLEKVMMKLDDSRGKSDENQWKFD
jgi:hypothetical protein